MTKYPLRFPRILSGVDEWRENYMTKLKIDERDHPKHRAWVRKRPCTVHGADCRGQVHAHHVRNGTDGGMGLKPHDRWVVPLCAYHHDELHRNGARSFERAYNVNLASEALALAERSPDRTVRRP